MRNIWQELLNKVSKYTDSQFSKDHENSKFEQWTYIHGAVMRLHL